MEAGIVLLFFFFFQAEDGIRDADVTGVQTCALPISPARTSALARTWPGGRSRSCCANCCGACRRSSRQQSPTACCRDSSTGSSTCGATAADPAGDQGPGPGHLVRVLSDLTLTRIFPSAPSGILGPAPPGAAREPPGAAPR